MTELRATAEEIAIGVVQRIFEVFNWNGSDPNMIRGWQQRLLSRTLQPQFASATSQKRKKDVGDNPSGVREIRLP